MSQSATSQATTFSKRQRQPFNTEVFLGEETNPGDFPDCCIVGLQFPDQSVLWAASGVFIHARVVLTAFHVLKASPNIVSIGTVSVPPDGPLPAANRLIVQDSRSPHGPHFLAPPAHNDIALLILKEHGHNVPVAKLAGSAELLVEAQALQIVGFGTNNRQETQGLGRQRVGNVEISEVHATEFRAGGGEESDTCVGDSGGPIYAGEGANRRVVGITSRSVQNGDCGAGGIYTSVRVYLNFIRDAASEFHIDIP